MEGMGTEEVPMAYPRSVVERALKVQEVILRALAGQLTWIQAAEILGCSPRTIRRLRWRWERVGYDGLFDRRRHTPSPKRAPVAEVQRVLTLYRDRYQGFNVRHFHQVARREHGVRFCYAFVKKALQTAGLVARQRARPPSASTRASALFRRIAAPRWQSPSLARPGPRAVVHADRDRRRCEQATALRRAAGGGRERGGDHGRPARCPRALRRAHGSLYRSRPLGRAHPDLGERPRSPPADPGGPSPRPAGDRAHPGLFPASARPE